MKKFAYLCCMILLSMNMMAQIDLNDKNWDTLFIEVFSGVRSWDSNWDDSNSIPNYTPLWRCFSYGSWDSGVTIFNHTTGECSGYQAYQPSHAVFGTDQTMKLISEFISDTSLFCGSGYSPAPWHKYCHYCEATTTDQHPQIHYYSGMIETIDPVGFGYYEIECKMPIHKHGECSSFWLWSCLGGTYNEIDVFEHNLGLVGNNIEKGILNGIWYNPNGTNYHNPGVGNNAHRYADSLYLLSSNSLPLNEYHTFGCLWMPDRVVWYVDGEIANICEDPNQIPQFPMWLKITHREDEFANSGTENNPVWYVESDTMTINYVKAYVLKSDCDTDVTIRSLSDFHGFDFKVKRSIAMGGLNNTLAIPSTSVFTMRAVESITIDKAFELPQGAKMTLLVHSCPKCSMENVVLPEYNCGINTDDEQR